MKYPVSDVFFFKLCCLGFPFWIQRSLLSLLFLIGKFILKKNTGPNYHLKTLCTQVHFLFLLQILFLLKDACHSWSFCAPPVLYIRSACSDLWRILLSEYGIIYSFSHVWAFRSFLILPSLFMQHSVGSIVS